MFNSPADNEDSRVLGWSVMLTLIFNENVNGGRNIQTAAHWMWKKGYSWSDPHWSRWRLIGWYIHYTHCISYIHVYMYAQMYFWCHTHRWLSQQLWFGSVMTSCFNWSRLESSQIRISSRQHGMNSNNANTANRDELLFPFYWGPHYRLCKATDVFTTGDDIACPYIYIYISWMKWKTNNMCGFIRTPQNLSHTL